MVDSVGAKSSNCCFVGVDTNSAASSSNSLGGYLELTFSIPMLIVLSLNCNVADCQHAIDQTHHAGGIFVTQDRGQTMLADVIKTLQH